MHIVIIILVTIHHKINMSGLVCINYKPEVTDERVQLTATIAKTPHSTESQKEQPEINFIIGPWQSGHFETMRH